MTELTITPRISDKTARFKGTVAAGEHVAVSVAGGGIAGTQTLRLRVVGPGGRTLAQFPAEENDAWGADFTCTLNLNTVQMLKAVPPGARIPLLFVLDDYDNKTLYFKDLCEVVHWPRRTGEEEPVNLDDYADLIGDFARRIDAAEDTIRDKVDEANGIVAYVAAAKTAAENARDSASGSATSAQTSATTAGNAATVAQAARNEAVSARDAINTPDATLTQPGIAADAKATGDKIAAEKNRAESVETTKADKSDTYTKTEVDAKVAAATPSDYDAVKGRVAAVEAKVPAQATADNQLADKAFVNSSIATSTATFRGTSDAANEAAFLAWLATLSAADANDYVFWRTTDAAGNTVFKRYKYDGAEWEWEFDLNNSSFTAEQWAAINSGLTAQQLAALLAEVAAKYAKPSGGIPATDLAQGVQASLAKADTALQEHQDISGKRGKTDLAAYGFAPWSFYDQPVFVWDAASGAWIGAASHPISSLRRVYYDPAFAAWIVFGDSAHAIEFSTSAPEDALELEFPMSGGSLVLTRPSVHVASGALALAAPNPTAGNFAALDADGNPVDSDVAPSDKLDATSLAPAFDATATYAVGRHVTYNGKLYRCTTAVATTGAWNAANWEAKDATTPDATLDVTSAGRLRLVDTDDTVLWQQGYDLDTVSTTVLRCDAVQVYAFEPDQLPAFDETTDYTAGDRVVYNGKAYVFTSDHGASEWAGVGVMEVTPVTGFVLLDPPDGKVGDFVLDIDNRSSSYETQATLIGLDMGYSVVVPKGQSLAQMLAFAAGEMAELYFTQTAFRVNNLPTWKIVKQVVENGGAQA